MKAIQLGFMAAAVATVLAALVGPAAPAAAADGELLTNTTFAADTNGWSNANPAVGAVTYAGAWGNPPGAMLVRRTSPGVSAARAAQCVNAVDGVPYDWSTDVRIPADAAPDTQVFIEVDAFTGPDCTGDVPSAGAYGAAAPNRVSWFEIELGFGIPQGTRSAMFRLVVQGSNGAKAYFDNPSFYGLLPLPAPPLPVLPEAPAPCVVTQALEGNRVSCADGRNVVFLGVGSPTGNQAGADWARAVTSWFLAGKTITLEQDVTAFTAQGVPVYPHVIGTDGADYNVSALLIYIGMARHDDDAVNNRYDGWFGAAEEFARSACWNMWGHGNPWAGESGC